MNILVISDTHGHGAYVREVLDRVKPDALLFAGDGLRDFSDITLPCPFYAVRGNCDWSLGATSDVGDEEVFSLGGVRILLMHGHRYGVKGGPGAAIARAEQLGADVLVFGHTHEPFDAWAGPDEDDGTLHTARRLLVCNPGSLGEYPHSFGILTVQNGQPLFSLGNA